MPSPDDGVIEVDHDYVVVDDDVVVVVDVVVDVVDDDVDDANLSIAVARPVRSHNFNLGLTNILPDKVHIF